MSGRLVGSVAVTVWDRRCVLSRVKLSHRVCCGTAMMQARIPGPSLAGPFSGVERGQLLPSRHPEHWRHLPRPNVEPEPVLRPGRSDTGSAATSEGLRTPGPLATSRPAPVASPPRGRRRQWWWWWRQRRRRRRFERPGCARARCVGRTAGRRCQRWAGVAVVSSAAGPGAHGRNEDADARQRTQRSKGHQGGESGRGIARRVSVVFPSPLSCRTACGEG